MNSSWLTFGHEKIKNILQKQLDAGKFSHAYLFSGPEGLGKKNLALEFARKILNSEKLDNHPDFQILDQTAEITMDLALNFMSRMSLMPFMGAYKVAVINNAENLNSQSGNALLKTLEDAAKSSIVILIGNSSRMLPTIVSRCQVLNFSGFGKAALVEFAKAMNLQINDDMLALSFGRPARLKVLALDNDFFNRQTKIVKNYQTALTFGLGERLISIATLAEMEIPELRENLLSWLFWQKQKLAGRPESYSKLRALNDCLISLGQNKNKKLVLQNLMLKI